MIAFKAFVRVVKSLTVDFYGSTTDTFGTTEVVREPLIYAKDKAEVKKYMIEKYPQFFPTAKVYVKETKDQAQFFYCLIYPLYEYELIDLESGEWTCAGCNQVHENQYISKPRNYPSFSDNLKFCRDYNNDDACLKIYKAVHLANVDALDDARFIKSDTPTYIYKITEKGTGKSYIGKTRNEPFFRWWNHLTHSTSPFGQYLRNSKISDWTFEVLEILDASIIDSEVFKIESKYMVEYDSINNGFNKVISSKKVLKESNLSLDLQVDFITDSLFESEEVALGNLIINSI